MRAFRGEKTDACYTHPTLLVRTSYAALLLCLCYSQLFSCIAHLINPPDICSVSLPGAPSFSTTASPCRSLTIWSWLLLSPVSYMATAALNP